MRKSRYRNREDVNPPDFFLLSPKEVFENYQREVKLHVSDSWMYWRKESADFQNRRFSQITRISRIFDFDISRGIQLAERLVVCF